MNMFRAAVVLALVGLAVVGCSTEEATTGPTRPMLPPAPPRSVPPPSLASVSPQTVPAEGGATVTIVGANLTGATAVRIDGATTSFVVSGDTIRAKAPAHALGGMFDVAVTTPGGTVTKVGAIAYWQAPAWNPTVLEAAPDPAVVYDPALRTAILKTGRPWRVGHVVASTQIEMLLIPNGTFWMGCTISSDMQYCPSEETPNHWVTLTQPFYLGRYEVTQEQWSKKTRYNPSTYQEPLYFNSGNRPVENVSWDDIVNKFQPYTGLRLPTEAEWEYAYRAGTTQAFHGWVARPEGFNEVSLVGNIGWWDGKSRLSGELPTQYVGQFPANGFGLHDMAGNVSEWVADYCDENYYKNSPSVDPRQDSKGFFLNGENRSVRGGAIGRTISARASSRGCQEAGYAPNSYNFGFRVARNAQ